MLNKCNAVKYIFYFFKRDKDTATTVISQIRAPFSCWLFKWSRWKSLAFKASGNARWIFVQNVVDHQDLKSVSDTTHRKDQLSVFESPSFLYWIFIYTYKVILNSLNWSSGQTVKTKEKFRSNHLLLVARHGSWEN